MFKHATISCAVSVVEVSTGTSANGGLAAVLLTAPKDRHECAECILHSWHIVGKHRFRKQVRENEEQEMHE